MKYILFFLSFFLLFSCTNSSEIEQAKQDLLSPETSVDTGTLDIEDDTSSDKEGGEDVISQEGNSVSVVSLTETQFIEVDDLSSQTLDDGEVIIEGKALTEVEKIEVTFSNKTSSFPEDAYTLKTFASGDDRFKYVASSRFQVLDFGVNEYLIKAYSGKEVSETLVRIQIEEQKDPTISYNEKIIGEEGESISLNLPESEIFGEPVSLGISSFTYSDISGLEIRKTDVSEFTCEGLTDTLSNTINTWFYWNTCRDIVKDKGISFYVLKLTGEDEYVYQKHYIDSVHGFYGVYDIETGTGVTKDTIQEKNEEYKEKNDTLAGVSVVDSLFRAIVSQD